MFAAKTMFPVFIKKYKKNQYKIIEGRYNYRDVLKDMKKKGTEFCLARQQRKLGSDKKNET